MDRLRWGRAVVGCRAEHLPGRVVDSRVGAHALVLGAAVDTVGLDLRVRFRISTQSGLAPDGSASDGEVEDYQVEIGGPYDWGDLPDTGFGTGPGNYQTLQSDGGAVHDLSVVGPFMGATVERGGGRSAELVGGRGRPGWVGRRGRDHVHVPADAREVGQCGRGHGRARRCQVS